MEDFMLTENEYKTKSTEKKAYDLGWYNWNSSILRFLYSLRTENGID